jgi:hypothetical protein
MFRNWQWRAAGLDEVPEGYRAMNDREALKVMVQP